MFRRYRVDIKPLVRAGNNTITITFTSKVQVAAERAAACEPATSQQCPSGKRSWCQHGFNNQLYLRTEPCSFSWDWGPGFAPQGIWRDIFIQSYADAAVVRDVLVYAAPRAASEEEAARTRDSSSFYDAADTYEASDYSDQAVIARAMRRTDADLDLSTWDLTVTAFLDSGLSDPSVAQSPSGKFGRSPTLGVGCRVCCLFYPCP